MANTNNNAQTVLVVNAVTGEEIVRNLTPAEIADLNEMQTKANEHEAQLETKAAARESALAKLAELGLTAEEIAAL